MLRSVFHFISTAILATAAFSVQAQSRPPAPGLKWQVMKLAVFNSKNFKSTASQDEIELARAIWENEIASIPANSSGPSLPAFVLVGWTQHHGEHLVFSSLSALGQCPPAENGSGAYDIYSVCKLRIGRSDGATASIDTVENFCHLYNDDKDNPADKNHTEWAFDAQARIAYFRVIQYGRHVPECDRRIAVK